MKTKTVFVSNTVFHSVILFSCTGCTKRTAAADVITACFILADGSQGKHYQYRYDSDDDQIAPVHKRPPITLTIRAPTQANKHCQATT